METKLGTEALKVAGSLHAAPAKTSGDAPSKPSISSVQRPTLEPMSRNDALRLVHRLMAGFPNLTAHDPTGYVAALVQVMSGYPKWAGEEAVVKVDPENAAFPPSDRLLRTWLDDAVRPWRFAAEWDARSAKQLAERDKIEGARR